MRAPRTTMPCAVSATLCRATSSPAAGTSPRVLSMVGCTMVWVRERSRRATSLWKATMLAAPRSLPLIDHSSDRPAKPATVALR